MCVNVHIHVCVCVCVCVCVVRCAYVRACVHGVCAWALTGHVQRRQKKIRVNYGQSSGHEADEDEACVIL